MTNETIGSKGPDLDQRRRYPAPTIELTATEVAGSTPPRARGEVDAQGARGGGRARVFAAERSPSPRPSRPKSDVSDFGQCRFTELG